MWSSFTQGLAADATARMPPHQPVPMTATFTLSMVSSPSKSNRSVSAILVKSLNVYRYCVHSSYQPGNDHNKTQDTLFYAPDLSRPAYDLTPAQEGGVRLTYQASGRNKFTVTSRPRCITAWT